MANFGFGGFKRPGGTRIMSGGPQVVEALGAIGGFGSGTRIGNAGAPHIPAAGEFGGIALEAGTGQRFPFTARVVGVPVPVLIVDGDGSLIV